MKIQGIDNLKERLRLFWALHISQHRVAKDIQAFTKRLSYWSRADIDGGATLVVIFGTNVCVRPAQLKIGRIFC